MNSNTSGNEGKNAPKGRVSHDWLPWRVKLVGSREEELPLDGDNMQRRKKITNKMKLLRSTKVGSICPVVGCDFVLTPSGQGRDSNKPAESAATVEHIRPLSDGGLHCISNIAIICDSCQKARNTLYMSKRKIQSFPRDYWTISLMSSMEDLLIFYFKEIHEEFLKIKAMSG